MQERTFNQRRRQFFRRRISAAEVLGSSLVLAVLATSLAWVAAQRDNYDPAERDLSFAVLQEQSVEDRLYKTPLKPWVEPGRSNPGQGTTTRLGVFPQQILADGWQVGTRLQDFNADNLYVKINGAAEQYLRYGFNALHYIALKRADTQDEINIELYDQGNFAGGLGIFSAQRDPAKALHRQGGLYYYETSVGAIGVMGRWYFKLAGNTESEVIREKSRQLIAALSGLPVAADEVPFGFSVLTGELALPFADVAYQAQNAFQYDFAQDFWFGRIAPGTDGRYFLHRATGADVAAGLYEQILTEQRYDYELEMENEERTLMRHRFLKSYFAMALNGPILFGVENVSNRGEVEPALDRLERAIRAASEQ